MPPASPSPVPPDVAAALSVLHAAGRLEPFLADLAVRDHVAHATARMFSRTVAPAVRDLGRQFRAVVRESAARP